MERRSVRVEGIPVFGQVVSWVRKLSSRFVQSGELKRLDADEVTRIARDFGMSVPDLHALESSGAHVRELLAKRLAGLELSEVALKEEHFAEFADLNRVCAGCASTRKCASDFQKQRPGHSEYCPNTDTLEALRATSAACCKPARNEQRN